MKINLIVKYIYTHIMYTKHVCLCVYRYTYIHVNTKYTIAKRAHIWRTTI